MPVGAVEEFDGLEVCGGGGGLSGGDGGAVSGSGLGGGALGGGGGGGSGAWGCGEGRRLDGGRWLLGGGANFVGEGDGAIVFAHECSCAGADGGVVDERIVADGRGACLLEGGGLRRWWKDATGGRLIHGKAKGGGAGAILAPGGAREGRRERKALNAFWR